MSLTESNYSPPVDHQDAGHEPGFSLRPEDILRVVLAGIVVLIGGLTLGNLTFHELQTRGTGYFILAGSIAIILTAIAFYRFQPTVALFTGLLWITTGGTPDIAQGVSSGTGKALYPVELGALFLLFIWILRGVSLRQFQIVRTPINKWLIAYFAFSVFTAANGWLFWDPALTHAYAGLPGGGKTPIPVVVLELMQRVLSIGMFWLMGSILTDPVWLRRSSYVLLVPGAIALIAHLHHLPDILNVYNGLLEIVLACALWAWLLEKPESSTPGRRMLAWLCLALIIFQVFYMNLRWISGWIGLFIGLFFVAWLKSRRLFAGLIGGGGLLILLAQPFLKSQVLHKVQTSGDLDRFSMQHAALMYALHFPLGVGPGNFRAYNMYYGSPAMWNTTTYTSAHNFYGQALSEMGFGGLILTLAWVIAGVLMLARFYRRSPPGFSRTMILAIGGMWAGLCGASYLGDYLIPVYHNGGLANLGTTIYAWIGLGIAVAHARANGALDADGVPAPLPPEPAPLPSASSYYPRRLTP